MPKARKSHLDYPNESSKSSRKGQQTNRYGSLGNYSVGIGRPRGDLERGGSDQHNMYRVSIELYKHELKFGRTRNAVGTRAAGECLNSFFEFSQTFTSVCITR